MHIPRVNIPLIYVHKIVDRVSEHQGNINSRNVHEGLYILRTSYNQFGITNSDWLLAPMHWSCRRACMTIV